MGSSPKTTFPIPNDLQPIRKFLGNYLLNAVQNPYSGQINAPINPYLNAAGSMLAGMYSGGQPQALAASQNFASNALGIKPKPQVYSPTPTNVSFDFPQFRSEVPTSRGNTGRDGTPGSSSGDPALDAFLQGIPEKDRAWAAEWYRLRNKGVESGESGAGSVMDLLWRFKTGETSPFNTTVPSGGK